MREAGSGRDRGTGSAPMKINPADQRRFEAQIAELIRTNKLPTLDQVRAAIETSKHEYATRIYIHGLRLAAEKLHREEFERIVNPAPVQMRFPFLAARAEKEVR